MGLRLCADPLGMLADQQTWGREKEEQGNLCSKRGAGGGNGPVKPLGTTAAHPAMCIPAAGGWSSSRRCRQTLGHALAVPLAAPVRGGFGRGR